MDLEKRHKYAIGMPDVQCNDIKVYGAKCNKLDDTDQMGCKCNEIEIQEQPNDVDSTGCGCLTVPLMMLSRLAQLAIDFVKGVARALRSSRSVSDCGGLAPFLRGGSALEEIIKVTCLVRDRRRRAIAQHLDALIDAATHAVLLEFVSLQGSYGVMLLATDGANTTLVTNRELRKRKANYIGAETGVYEYQLPGQTGQQIVDLLTRPPFSQLTDVVSGDAEVLDSRTQFLTFKTGNVVRRMALYGYRYPGLASGPLKPTAGPDKEIWEANAEVHEMWRQSMITVSKHKIAVRRAWRQASRRRP